MSENNDNYNPIGVFLVSNFCSKNKLTVNIFIAEQQYNTIILAIAHKEFLQLDLTKMKANGSLIYDIKTLLSKEMIDGRL